MKNPDTFINPQTKNDWAIYVNKLFEIGEFIAVTNDSIEENTLLCQMGRLALQEEKILFSQGETIELDNLNKELKKLSIKLKHTYEDTILLADKLLIHKINYMAN